MSLTPIEFVGIHGPALMLFSTINALITKLIVSASINKLRADLYESGALISNPRKRKV